MADRTKVVVLGRGHDLSTDLQGALGDVGFERISDEPFARSMHELGTRKPTVVILDEGMRADEETIDALRSVVPQAWFLDHVGIVRRRPEGGHAFWPVTKPFVLEPL